MTCHWLLAHAFRRHPRVYADGAQLGFDALLTQVRAVGVQLITHNVQRLWVAELSWQQLADHYEADLTTTPLRQALELRRFHSTIAAGKAPIPELLERAIAQPSIYIEKGLKMTTAATVHVDFNRRSCILLSRVAGQVTFISSTEPEGYAVTTWDETLFDRTYLTPLPSYPASRAARLYVEFARYLGATPAAMTALGHLTTLTPEELTMATKQVKAVTGETEATPKKATPKKAAPKKATPKKAAPKKATVPTEKPIQASDPSVVAGERKGTAAALFKQLIMEGTKTDNAIFAEVQAAFGLDESKRGYVKWYRNYLVKQGENPPPAVEA